MASPPVKTAHPWHLPPGVTGAIKVESTAMSVLWAQSIRLTWRPELRFYEKRVSILQSFEQRGDLRAFRVQENFVDARLFDSRDRLSVRQDGLDLHLDRPDADVDRAWEAVETSISTVGPSQPRTIMVSFQHLTTLDMSFAEAVRRAYGGIFGRLGTESIRLDDWALLVDVWMHEESFGQMEFGVVRADEVPGRLSRSSGRIGTRQPEARDLPKPDELEPVSLFSDFWVSRNLAPGDEFGSEAHRFWHTARIEAGKLVTTLERMLVGDDIHGEMAR